MDKALIQPHDKELEESILSALIMHNGAYDEVSGILTEETFYYDNHKKIFSAISELNSKSQPIDILTITEQLRKRGELDEIGGMAAIVEITKNIPSHNIEFYSMVLKEKEVARDLINYSYGVQKNGFDPTADVGETLAEANAKLEKIQEKFIGQNSSGAVKDISNIYLTDLQRKIDNYKAGVNNGINTGIYELNKITSGWQEGKLIIVAGRPAMGKALKMDAKILTPKGWVLNRDIKVGDEVSSIDGRKSFVTGVYPQGLKKMCEILFSDGRKIECSEDHLWEVKSYKFCGDSTRILSTKEIKEKLSAKRYQGRMSIPLFNGDFGVTKDFVFHPYLIGVLLGDGCLTKGVLWNKPDLFIAKKVSNLGYVVKGISNDFRIMSKMHTVKDVLYRNAAGYDVFVNDAAMNVEINYCEELRTLGLYGKRSHEKFIPKEYLNASREQRIQLLNGLLDTDGDIGKRGAVCYNTVSEQLAKDVQQLCWSLGYKCSMTKRKSFLYGVRKRDSYRLCISARNEFELFTLPHKAERARLRKTKPLTIISVVENGVSECQCISVSHERKLYITDDYLVTHNTSLAIHFGLKAAENGIPVLMFSLEMPNTEIYDRLILSRETINPEILKTGNISSDEILRILSASDEIKRLPIYIDDTSGVTIDYIRSQARLFKKRGQCGMVIIDYLQILGSKGKFGNRQEEVSAMSRKAKNLSRELNVPVILLSQLSRASESRTDKRPLLSDLRESGAIEQDADIVAFVHRPEYYKEPNAVPNSGEIIIAKHRAGKTGTARFMHNGSLTQIFDYDDRGYSSIAPPPSRFEEDPMPF